MIGNGLEAIHCADWLRKAIIGSFAPHGINVVVIIVILRSLSFSMVREAIIPGTPQPLPISIGINDWIFYL